MTTLEILRKVLGIGIPHPEVFQRTYPKVLILMRVE